MANKFLGEAGLAVLVEEIKKKSTSESKSMLDVLLEKATLWNESMGTDTPEGYANYCKAIYAQQMLTFIAQEITTATIPDNPATTQDVYNWINNVLDTPIEETHPEITNRVLLSEDHNLLAILLAALETIRVSNGKLQYRDNPGEQTWHDYNPVSEISADEVTNKFNTTA